MNRETEAKAIVSGKLLADLFEGYKYNVFDQWASEDDNDKRNELYARVVAANDLEFYLKEKARAILDGTN
jgi:hypothetical protein